MSDSFKKGAESDRNNSMTDKWFRARRPRTGVQDFAAHQFTTEHQARDNTQKIQKEVFKTLKKDIKSRLENYDNLVSDYKKLENLFSRLKEKTKSSVDTIRPLRPPHSRGPLEVYTNCDDIILAANKELDYPFLNIDTNIALIVASDYGFTPTRIMNAYEAAGYNPNTMLEDSLTRKSCLDKLKKYKETAINLKDKFSKLIDKINQELPSIEKLRKDSDTFHIHNDMLPEFKDISLYIRNASNYIKGSLTALKQEVEIYV